MGATRASDPFVQNCRDGSDTWERLNIRGKIPAKIIAWVMRVDPNKLAPQLLIQLDGLAKLTDDIGIGTIPFKRQVED